MTVADSLRRFRKEFNLTQRAVAEAVGMNETAYQRYERGTREPAFKQLLAIAEAFNVSIDYLVGRVDTPPATQAEKPLDTQTDNFDSVERELVTIFRRLETNERNTLVQFAEFLNFLQADNRALLKKLKAFQTDVSPEAVVG